MKTLTGGNEFPNWRQMGCIFSIIDNSTIVGFNRGVYEPSSVRNVGGLEWGTWYMLRGIRIGLIAIRGVISLMIDSRIVWNGEVAYV